MNMKQGFSHQVPVLPLYRQKGAVTIIAVMLMATIVTLSLLFTFKTSNTGVTDSLNQSANVAALFLAESGLEYATQQISSGAASCGAMAATTQAFGRGSFTINTTETTDYDGVTALPLTQCRIQVSGTVTVVGSDVKRTVQSVISSSGGSGVIAFDNVESRTRNNANSANWNHRITGTDPVLVVAISLSGTFRTVTSITYNGIALSSIGSRNGTGVRVEMWYLQAPPTGNHSVNVNLSGNTRFVVSSVSFTGVDQISPIEDTRSGAGFSTSPTPSPQITTVTNNAWVIDVLAKRRSTPTPAVGPGQIQLWNNNTGGSPLQRITGAGAYRGPVSPAGIATMNWTLSTARPWAILAAAIKPSTAGSAGVLSWRELSQ